jgi:pimeloyl-ACP methyl ester carboxylesterase
VTTPIVKSRTLFSAVMAVSALSTSLAAAQTTEVCFAVSLRGGASEICADVHTNTAAPAAGATILAVHGFTETAETWVPLKNALFADTKLKKVVRRVIAIDLPGHGDSEAPVGLPGGKFGDLTINENVSIVIQSVDILRAQGLGSRVLMGHSMGGLAVQGAQEALLAGGSSLAQHGVFGAILVAPVPTSSVNWTRLAPPPNLAPFVVTDPALGTYLDIPGAVAKLGGGFTKLSDGQLVPNTPSDAVMADYTGWEPITTALQLTDQLLPALPRPAVRQGAFAPIRGTLLALISFSQDVLTPQVDHKPLYEYLIGRQGLLYRPIATATAVHNMHITEPANVIAAIRDQIASMF